MTEVGILNIDDGYTRSDVLQTRRNEAAQNDSLPSSSWKGPQSHRLSVKPSFRKRPNVIAVETRKMAGVPTTRPVDIVPMPQVIVNKNCGSWTVSGVEFPEEPDVSPAKITEEANTGGAMNEQHLHDDQNFKQTTNVTNLGGGQRRLYSDATGVGRSGSHKEQRTHSGDGISWPRSTY